MTNKNENSGCNGSYEVSGYITKDGKKVSSYTRTCWKHGSGGGSGSGVQNTQNNIEKTNEKLDKINNKEEITDEDLGLSKGYLSATISKVCEDCENYLDEENGNKVEIPTWESVEMAKNLKNTKSRTLDNIEKTMHTVDKIDKIQKKKWDSINSSDVGYYSKLQEYAKNKEIIDKINKTLGDLHYAVSNSWGIAKNYIGDLKTLSNEELSGAPTGYAAGIKNNPINKIKNYIDHGGENGNPIWFLPENYDSQGKREGNWTEYLRLWPETNKRLENFYSRPDINITNKEKNIKNDMRHITGPAFFAQLYGSETSRLLSYLKESRDILLQRDLKDSIVDMKNNDLGIQIGLKYPNMNRDKLIELIYELYIKQKGNK